MSNVVPGGGLPDSLIDLVAHVTASLGAVSREIVRQATAATVVRASPTMVDVTVPQEIPPIPLSDGPAPGQALVYDGDRLAGEVLVWLRDGRLIGLEQAWYTDEPPTTWPGRDRVTMT